MASRSWSIVGRADETAFLIDAVADGRGAVVAGGAGMGKTTVVDLAATALRAAGWTVTAHTATTERRPVPFAPFASLAAGAHADQLARMTAAVAAVKANDRHVLVVNDVQWLDDVSATFLRMLFDATSARLLLTLRTGDDRGRVPVEDLWRSGGIHRVDLQPLTRREVAALIAEQLEEGDTAAVAGRIAELTRGNPLYIRELVRASLASGGLRRDGATWKLVTPPIDALDELLGARLDLAQTAEQQHCLGLLAVADELGLTTLEEVVGADAVAELERLGLITMVGSGQRYEVGLSHPIYAELVRSRLGVTGTRAMRREALELFDRAGTRRPGDLVRAAVWRAQLGDHDDPALLLEAATYLTAGFQHAWTAGATEPSAAELIPTAIAVAEAARDAGAGFQAIDLLVGLYAEHGEPEKVRQAMAELERAASTDGERVRCAVLRASHAFEEGGGDERPALAVLDAIAGRIVDPACRRSLDAFRALTYYLVNRCDEALALATEILGDPVTARVDRMQALRAACGALASTGRPVDAIGLVDLEISLLGADTLTTADGVMVIVRMVALVDAGRLAEAEQMGQLGVAAADSVGWSGGVAAFATTVAMVQLLRDLDAAIASARSAMTSAGAGDRFGTRRGNLATLAMALAARGELDAAESALAELSRSALRSRLFEVAEARAIAAVAAGRGHLATARRVLEDAARVALGDGRRTAGSTLLHDLVRLGFADVSGRLDACAAGCQGDLIPARAAHGRALAAGDGVALDAVSRTFEELGAVVFAAEAAAQAARCHARGRLHARAAASAARASELGRRCGAATPALVDRPEDVVVLTAREHEIAALAASGLSDRVIATRLGLSPRTVQSHLYAAYGKLGVTGRDDLATALQSAAPA